MKIEKQWLSFSQAILNLEKALSESKNEFIRDSVIKRFELAYETTWKLLQSLAREQGLEVSSPRQAFQTAFKLGWITDETLWFEMIATRNIAVHTYSNDMAEAVYEKVKLYVTGLIALKSKLSDLLD